MSPDIARDREEGRAAVEQLAAAFSENLDYYKSPEVPSLIRAGILAARRGT